MALRSDLINGFRRYISMGKISYNQGVDMATMWSRILYGREIPVRCLLSLISAFLSIDSLVWLYEANGLVCPAHTSLCEIIDYLTTVVLIWQPSS